MYYQHVKLIVFSGKTSINTTYLAYYHNVTYLLIKYSNDNSYKLFRC